LLRRRASLQKPIKRKKQISHDSFSIWKGIIFFWSYFLLSVAIFSSQNSSVPKQNLPRLEKDFLPITIVDNQGYGSSDKKGSLEYKKHTTYFKFTKKRCFLNRISKKY
jgi:hypothetical protein